MSRIIDIGLEDRCDGCLKKDIEMDKMVIRNGVVTLYLRCGFCGCLWNRTYLFKARAKTL